MQKMKNIEMFFFNGNTFEVEVNKLVKEKKHFENFVEYNVHRTTMKLGEG